MIVVEMVMADRYDVSGHIKLIMYSVVIRTIRIIDDPQTIGTMLHDSNSSFSMLGKST